MYDCMCVCIYIYTCMCICTYVCVYTYIYMYLRIFINLYIIHLCGFVHISLYRLHTHLLQKLRLSNLIHLHTYIHIFIYLHIYVCVNLCVQITHTPAAEAYTQQSTYIYGEKDTSTYLYVCIYIYMHTDYTHTPAEEAQTRISQQESSPRCRQSVSVSKETRTCQTRSKHKQTFVRVCV